MFQKFPQFFGIENSFIKYEGFNIVGSVKLKTAQLLEEKHNISPNKNIIIESSSGNLGIALSMIC